MLAFSYNVLENHERNKLMKARKVLTVFLITCILMTCLCGRIRAALPTGDISVAELDTTFECASVILIEASTGKVLFEQNSDEALPPASVTKIMTLLLVMEAIEEGKLSLDEMVTTSAHAASMGGSQIYLEEGEQMCVEDMIKSVVIASANDAAVALAEHIAGSEESFVELMNKRAKELGMTSTNFENTNGLDDTAQNHVTSARDIAIMSAKLLSYDKITEYSSIWMDTVRNGEFGLTNTNRLVRFYKGANGLKTGSTSKAKFCISASAERDEMTLICVVMAAPTRDIRNAIATALLDWGFANFSLYSDCENTPSPIRVSGGEKSECMLENTPFNIVLGKGDKSNVSVKCELPESVPAPIKKGDKIGEYNYYLGDELIGSCDIVAAQNVEKITFWGLLSKFFAKMALL